MSQTKGLCLPDFTRYINSHKRTKSASVAALNYVSFIECAQLFWGVSREKLDRICMQTIDDFVKAYSELYDLSKLKDTGRQGFVKRWITQALSELYPSKMTLDDIKNQEFWTPYIFYPVFVRRIKSACGDPFVHAAIGSKSMELTLRKGPRFKDFVDLAISFFGKGFGNLEYLVTTVASHVRTFNDLYDMIGLYERDITYPNAIESRIILPSGAFRFDNTTSRAYVITKYHEDFPCEINFLDTTHYRSGIISAIPHIAGYGYSQNHLPLLEYDLPTLINLEGSRSGHSAQLNQGILSINEERVGHVVALVPSELKQTAARYLKYSVSAGALLEAPDSDVLVYLGHFEDLDLQIDPQMKDLPVPTGILLDKDVPFLFAKAGQIFSAPYTVDLLEWKKTGPIQRAYVCISNTLSLMAKGLEDKVDVDRQRVEKESQIMRDLKSSQLSLRRAVAESFMEKMAALFLTAEAVDAIDSYTRQHNLGVAITAHKIFAKYVQMYTPELHDPKSYQFADKILREIVDRFRTSRGLDEYYSQLTARLAGGPISGGVTVGVDYLTVLEELNKKIREGGSAKILTDLALENRLFSFDIEEIIERTGPEGVELGVYENNIFSALLHDIGKVRISSQILQKSGKLTEEEFKIMMTHPVQAYILVKNVPTRFLSRLLEGALFHQEKYDGSGYPFGLRGDNIPLGGRVTAIADVYDALTSNRPYRDPPSYPPEEAAERIIKGSGTHFDPLLVNAFIKVMIDEGVLDKSYRTH